MRKPNYRQQKKAREHAKKTKQAEKLVRRQPAEGAPSESLETVAPTEKLPSTP